MSKKFLSVIKYVLILSIGGVMLWLAFRGVRLKDTIDEMMQADFFWLFLSVAASLIAFFSRAIRWNLLIEPLGYKPSVVNTSAALMIGYLANLAVPRLGEVTRCGTLSKIEKLSFDSLLGTVIIERIVDVICLLLCILFVALIELERLGDFFRQNIIYPFKSKFSSAINNPVLIILVALIIIALLYFIFRKKEKKENSLMDKFVGLLKGIIKGIDTIRKMKSPAAFIFHTILIWTMYFFMSYFCFFSLKSTSLLDWQAGLFVLVVGGMGMSAPVQGGIGAYHLLVSQGLMLYGISHDHGLTFATLMHTSQTLVVIILGGISFLYLFLKRKNEKLT